MKKNVLYVGLVLGLLTVIFCYSERKTMLPRDDQGYVYVNTIDDVYKVYPKTIADIKARSELVQKEVKALVDSIVAVPAEQQNKENMIYALDRAAGYIEVELGLLELVHLAYPDEAMVKAAAEQELVLKGFIIEHLSNNSALYSVLKSYNAGNAKKDNLLPEEQYALQEALAEFKRAGLDLPEEQRNKVVELQKKLQKLGQDFGYNINTDTTTITATKEQLGGVTDDFLLGLKKNDAGEYILPMDYPVADMVMSYSTVGDTRKRFSKAFKNRAYPVNVQVLDDLIAARHELAKLLGFESYAHLDLDNQMVKTPERARSFQMDLKERMLKKANAEFKQLVTDLPEGVELTKDGKLHGWDAGFVSTYFKKKHYDIDELKLAEYFPLEQTIQGLMEIYEKFFDIKIETIVNPQAWHADVRLLKVTDNTQTVRGYIFLDMFPRKGKYTHACMVPGVKTIRRNNTIYPTVTSVLCNFTKPVADKPSLLKYSEVNTFFHEFGHAIHAVLGATRLVSQAGTSVKTDFVELPSQLLESWLEEKEILQGLTQHYKTGEPMPDELIDNKLEQLKFGLGMRYAGQLQFGMIALDCFDASEHKDVNAIVEGRFKEFSPHSEYDPETHFQCSFGHLNGYGAKYYGYLWSRVFALDIFAQIKKEGLLNPAAGKRYVDTILGVGGSKDPNQMLRDYLGREPKVDAFFEKMGF